MWTRRWDWEQNSLSLGANFSLGWELNEQVSIGGAATVTYAYLDLGLARLRV